jgi:hypothetical protein
MGSLKSGMCGLHPKYYDVIVSKLGPSDYASLVAAAGLAVSVVVEAKPGTSGPRGSSDGDHPRAWLSILVPQR